jgi:hypothetical protein
MRYLLFPAIIFAAIFVVMSLDLVVLTLRALYDRRRDLRFRQQRGH